jgi:very-short-patch-repair endonuclease
MEVIAIIELDDPSHLEKAEEDRIRDQMLTEAGYTVRRYTNIPSVRQLQKDIH